MSFIHFSGSFLDYGQLKSPLLVVGTLPAEDLGSDWDGSRFVLQRDLLLNLVTEGLSSSALPGLGFPLGVGCSS